MSAESRGRPGPLEPEPFTLVAGGLRLAGLRWRPPGRPAPGRAPEAASGAPRPVVIVHGIGEHLGRHRALAERLAAAGRLVVGADLRGHGRSEGPRGHVERFDDYLDDLDLVVAEACRAQAYRVPACDAARPTRAPVLIGHSLGALIVLRYAGRRFASPSLGAREAPPPAGLVLAGIGLQVAVAVPRWKRFAGRVCERLLPRLPFRTGIDPEALSTDPSIAKAYREDPLAHGVITPRWYAAYEAARAAAPTDAGSIRCPVLVLHGLDDRIADAEGSRQLARALRQADVTLRLYPGARHELFTDPAARDVLDDLETWLCRVGP